VHIARYFCLFDQAFNQRFLAVKPDTGIGCFINGREDGLIHTVTVAVLGFQYVE